MAQSKKRKPTKKTQNEVNTHEGRAFNPTKSGVGRIVIVILALGMFLAMLISMFIGAWDVLFG